MWVCCQIGCREHYAVARALHRRRLLAALVTDWYAFGKKDAWKSASLAGAWNRGLQAMVGRNSSARSARCDDIPDSLVQSLPLRSLLWKWKVRSAARQGRLFEAYAETDAAFGVSVTRLKLPEHKVLFGYSYASREILEVSKSRGVLTVLGQTDPGAAEFRLVAKEMNAHPEVAGPAPSFPWDNFERNRREWDLADIIVVNSEWSRDAIVGEGANPDKVNIVPLAYEAEGTATDVGKGRESREGPLRVLWLGQVNVRKGIHYLIEAARLLEGEDVQVDVVGPVGILRGAVASAPGNVKFHGPVIRDRAAEWYRHSDVFVLPTLSDGFALTQLEALAHGLPVIATPNCGRVVEEGKTGFIIPSRDSRALATAIVRFVRDRGLVRDMSPLCRAAVRKYSLDNLGQRLAAISERCFGIGS